MSKWIWILALIGLTTLAYFRWSGRSQWKAAKAAPLSAEEIQIRRQNYSTQRQQAQAQREARAKLNALNAAKAKAQAEEQKIQSTANPQEMAIWQAMARQLVNEAQGTSGGRPARATTAENSQYYSVKPEDSLESIAKRYYGNADFAGALLRANPAIKNPSHLPPGLIMRLPGREEFKQ